MQPQMQVPLPGGVGAAPGRPAGGSAAPLPKAARGRGAAPDMCAGPAAKKLKPSPQAPALPPKNMSPTTVDSKLGDGASKAGWTGKLYGQAKRPQYSHPVYGRNHTSAKDAKDAWVSRAN